MNKPLLKDLPYEISTLEPVLSKELLSLHHDKHHAAYVNNAIATIDKIEKNRITKDFSNQKSLLKDLSFNLNGHLLHDLYWNVMRSPQDDNKPSSDFTEKLTNEFGSYENFVEEFSRSAVSVEGSGWCALLKNDEKDLVIMQIENHNKLYLTNYRPILIIDVWEHAYYLDYKNDRAKYVSEWWKVVNWEKVEALYQE